MIAARHCLNHRAATLLRNTLTWVGVLACGLLAAATLWAIDDIRIGGVFLANVLCLAWILWRFVYRADAFWHPVQFSVIILIIELVLCPFGIFAMGMWQKEWLESSPDRQDLIFRALAVVTVGLWAFAVGLTLPQGRRRGRAEQASRAGSQPTEGVGPVLVLMFLAAVGAFVRWRYLGAAAVLRDPRAFGERIVVGAGTGYMELFATCGYVAVIVQAWRYFTIARGRKRNFVLLLVAAAIAGLSFAMVGVRGRSLYPLCLIAAVGAALSPARGRWIRTIPFAIPAIMILGVVTHYWRTSFTETHEKEVTLADVIPNLVYPQDFAHVELLGGLIAQRDQGARMPDTMVASLLNWRPRSLFPSKGLTTGPVIALMMSKYNANKRGEHITSYTTGPFIELYYHGGVPAVMGGMFLLGMLMTRLAVWHRRHAHSAVVMLVFMFEAYLLGWDLWVNDLGGNINQQVLFAVALVLYLGLRAVRLPRRWGVPGRWGVPVEARNRWAVRIPVRSASRPGKPVVARISQTH